MAAGDVSKLLNGNVRTLIDESLSDITVDAGTFFTNTDVYNALTNAQREVVKFAYAKFISTGKLSDCLGTIRTESTALSVLFAGTTPYAWAEVPTNFLYLISARYSITSVWHGVGIVHKNPDFESRYINNVYATPTASDPIGWLESSNINFIPTNGTTAYITYLKDPGVISASADPLVLASVYKALVNYAVAEVLMRERIPEALQQSALLFKEFLDEMQLL